MSLLQANAPLHRRLGGYLAERFPPVVYTVLVVLFFGSALTLAQALSGADAVPARAWVGAIVVWLAFLHLRLMDEHKDFAVDQVAHPDRLLSRGVVTLPLLGRLLWAVVVVEALLAAWLGIGALTWWGAMFGFTLLMRVEFGLGSWLSQHIVLYAITHNPVVGLLAVFAHAATGLEWDPRYLGYVALVSLGSLAFEVARKTREPGEEITGVESYSSALGRGGAAGLLWALVLMTLVAGLWVIVPFLGETGGRIGAGVLVLGAGLAGALARPGVPAKKVELGGSLLLLLSFVSVGVAAW